MTPRLWGLLPLIAVVLTGGPAWGGLLTANDAILAGSADLNYLKPPDRSEAGLPIGNGRTGTLLWTQGNSLRMEINRVDVFGNDCTSTSFPERNSDYCGGCGFVDIDFGPGATVFPLERCPEHLSCYDGMATITGR